MVKNVDAEESIIEEKGSNESVKLAQKKKQFRFKLEDLLSVEIGL
jgi:hypothetical protein